MTPVAAVATPAAPVRGVRGRGRVRAPEAGPVLERAAPDGRPLRVRWLGRVPYRDAWSLQRALHVPGPTTTTCCSSSSTPTCTRWARPSHPEHGWSTPARWAPNWCRSTGAATPPTTWLGQLVGYPVLTLPPPRVAPRTGRRGGLRPGPLEDVLVAALADLGSPTRARSPGTPAVWIGPGAAPETGAAETDGHRRGGGDRREGAGRQVDARVRRRASTPTWPCSGTSSRAASPTPGVSRRWPGAGASGRDARRRRRRRRPLRPAALWGGGAVGPTRRGVAPPTGGPVAVQPGQGRRATCRRQRLRRRPTASRCGSRGGWRPPA